MEDKSNREYRPFIPECRKRGIGKTKAYELANAGLLEVFNIGTRKFIFLDSLLSLPRRLQEEAGGAGVASPAQRP